MDDFSDIPEQYKNKSPEWYRKQYFILLRDRIIEAEKRAEYYRKNKERIKAKTKERIKSKSGTGPPRPRGRPRKYPIPVE